VRRQGASGSRFAFQLLLSLRPEQWLKNGFVFAPLVFAGRLDDLDAVVRTIGAAVAFCFAASATYLINDVLDRRSDRAHPVKRLRPIASGAVSLNLAIALAAGLFAVAVGIAVLLAGWFPTVLIGYIAMTTLYSTLFKNAVFVDVMVVAAGFVLRVVGGATVIPVPVSHWLLLCAFLLALYLALGKRRAELLLLGDEAGGHRPVLRSYTLPLVDQTISVVLGATVVAYCLYTVAPGTVANVGSEGLMATVPFVLYGLFRYLYLLHTRDLGDSPTRALVGDRPLLICVLAWAAVSAAIIAG
jgi:4-hydroxybenzoate polyprenyltransferase